MASKQFIGSVKVIKIQYGEMIKISLGENDRKKLEETKNEKGWNNLVLKKSKGEGYYLEIDDWKPTGGQTPPPPPPAGSPTGITPDGEEYAQDLPF